MNDVINDKKPQRLWNKNFTIITLGSMISMLGNSISGFAMSLLVLDYTGSSFLYGLYIFFFTLPMIVTPIISGPLLDRFSRRKMIYMLDFISSAIYLILALVVFFDLFNFPILALFCLLIGTIESIYSIAYESFYPLLISEGNYSKAYSIASTLNTLTMVMVPISAVIYNAVGIVPLFLFNAASFLIAAIFETQIKADESHLASADGGGYKRKQYLSDLREGFAYLKNEKGLLAIALYFTVSSFSGGVSSVITLPFFRDNFSNGEYVYIFVWGFMTLGRVIGGGIHYKFKLPASKKYIIALMVYCVISALEGSYLFFSIPVMMAMCFMIGILGVTSYNIRISATQSYVPDNKKGRFNGLFLMMMTVGSLTGEITAGLLAEFIPKRIVLSIAMGICLIAGFIFIGGNKKSVSQIYNRNA